MLGGIVNVHIELDEQFTFNRFFGAFVFAGIGESWQPLLTMTNRNQ